MRYARQYGLTTKEYVWIVTQPVIGSGLEAPAEFVPGMLGVHFETDTRALVNEIETCMTVFAHGLSMLHNARHIPRARKEEMIHCNVSCYSNGPVQWSGGLQLRQYLAGVNIPPGRSNKPHSIAFNSDGSLKYVELKIMNLRPPSEAFSGNRWEEIGVWNSETSDKVDIKDIVWPGEALKPPEGVPERGFLSITFLEVRNDRPVQCWAFIFSAPTMPDSADLSIPGL